MFLFFISSKADLNSIIFIVNIKVSISKIKICIIALSGREGGGAQWRAIPDYIKHREDTEPIRSQRRSRF